MPRVFVTNYAGHDFQAAEKFGEIYFLTRGYVSFQSLDRVNFAVAKALHDFNVTEEDYLLFSGVSIICILSALLWYRKFKKCRMLIWDPPTKEYRLMEVHDGLYEVLEKEVKVA